MVGFIAFGENTPPKKNGTGLFIPGRPYFIKLNELDPQVSGYARTLCSKIGRLDVKRRDLGGTGNGTRDGWGWKEVKEGWLKDKMDGFKGLDCPAAGTTGALDKMALVHVCLTPS